MSQRFRSFAEFYPFYLQEHQNPVCRGLHYSGSLLSLGVLGYLAVTGQWAWIWLALVVGYGFAWIGHFVFEKNRPATFQYPFYSFLGDWVMLWHFLTGHKHNQHRT